MSFLFSPRQQEAPCLYELQEEEPLLVSVCLNSTGLATLRQQLAVDLKEKGNTPLSFKFQELLALQHILLVHSDREGVEAGDNILLTPDQRNLLASYVGRYYHRAWECRDAIQLQVYSELLVASTTLSTLLSRSDELPLPYLIHELFTYARPLSVLWDRLCAHFGRHQRLEQFETTDYYATL